MLRVILVNEDGTRQTFVPESHGSTEPVTSHESTRPVEVPAGSTVDTGSVEVSGEPPVAESADEDEPPILDPPEVEAQEQPDHGEDPDEGTKPEDLGEDIDAAKPDNATEEEPASEFQIDHAPSVFLRWSFGATPASKPITFALLGSGLWTVALEQRENRLAFTHFDEEKSYECDNCKSIGKAKSRATTYSREMVSANEHDAAMRQWAETWVTELASRLPSIRIGDIDYRFSKNRIRRE
ncbi:MAG: hypothetical protein ACPG4T_18520, partial [Nannocystaceae bacterium]